MNTPKLQKYFLTSNIGIFMICEKYIHNLFKLVKDSQDPCLSVLQANFFKPLSLIYDISGDLTYL